MRELRPKARAILSAAQLPAHLQYVEDAVIPRSEATVREIRTLMALCRQIPDWRAKEGRDYPKETTFQRILAKLDAKDFERILIAWELQRARQLSGEPPAIIDDQVAIDGKAQRGSTPHVVDGKKAQLVSAQSQPSGRVLGTVAVEYKSNEVPAARALLEKLGPLDGKLLMLDALHSCQQTLRQAHQDNGADFLIPV